MHKPLRIFSAIALLLLNISASAQSSRGLIGHWKLSGNGADSSGNGLHGTVYGAATDSGRGNKPGTAMRFDGNSYIAIPYSPLFNTAQFSIAAIVSLDVFNPDVCNLNSIFWLGNEFMSGGYGMIVFDNAYDSSCHVADTAKNVFAGTISTNNHSGTHAPWQYNPTVKAHRWYSAVLTYDGATARVYVDGALMATNYLGDPVGADRTSGAMIGMRYNNNGAYPYPWNGRIDDVRLYNRLLADSEILAYHHYDTGSVAQNDTTTAPVDTSLGIGISKTARLDVFPNPATGVINIKTSGAPSDITIVNSLGQLIFRQSISQSHMQIESGSWPRGLYFVHVRQGETVQRRQILLH